MSLIIAVIKFSIRLFHLEFAGHLTWIYSPCINQVLRAVKSAELGRILSRTQILANFTFWNIVYLLINHQFPIAHQQIIKVARQKSFFKIESIFAIPLIGTQIRDNADDISRSKRRNLIINDIVFNMTVQTWLIVHNLSEFHGLQGAFRRSISYPFQISKH